nr:dienelactone hydrolase family protein [Sphingobium sp. AS12]
MSPVLDQYSSNTEDIPLEIFLPPSPGPSPAVLVLHGSFGLLPEYKPDIVSFAEALAAAGVAAIMPQYLKSTGTEPGDGVLKLIPVNHLVWAQACADALTWIAGDPRFDVGHVGILGFSLGGYLALRVAMDPPGGVAVQSVVDFFGPTHLLDAHWSKLPPVLIFHGSVDKFVDPSESEFLVQQLEAAGRAEGTGYNYELVEGQGHGFKGAALTESRDKTTKFLTDSLG